MRVEIVLDSVGTCSVARADLLDLRSNPQAIGQIEPARHYPPLRGFLTHVNGSDSIFSTFGCKVWTSIEDDKAEPSVFASRVDLIFLQEAINFGRGPHEELARQLARMLEHEPSNALRVELHVSPAEFSGENSGFCLRLLLYASGATPSQAQVRWGLGLARMQQALLFLSRAIRQQPSAEEGG